MPLNVQWSIELVTAINLVPRLQHHLIGELFYLEDEIGEMRHAAFMIECGLEEDPLDGPDVQPLPCGDILLQQQHQQKAQHLLKRNSRHNRNDSDSECNTYIWWRRELPARARS